MNDTDYIEEYTEDDENICQDFNWEHIVIEGEPAVKLYLTNAKGEYTQVIFNKDTLGDFMVGAADYLEYLSTEEEE